MQRFAALALLLALACAPQAANEHLSLADGERARGNDVHARNLYRQYLERYPHDASAPRVRLEIGRIHFEREDYVAAVREFTFIANAYPDDPALWKALLYGGVAYARLGHCAQALKFLSIVVAGADGHRRAPDDMQRQAQQRMDEINEDMQGAHRVCTVKPMI